jgi:hypothetical protein
MQAFAQILIKLRRKYAVLYRNALSKKNFQDGNSSFSNRHNFGVLNLAHNKGLEPPRHDYAAW